MKRLICIWIALVLLQADLLPGQTPGQPPVEACKPGDFTVIGFPDEFGPKRDRRFRVRIDQRFEGDFLTTEPIWVPVIEQSVQKWNGLSGADLSFELEGLTDQDAFGFDGILTIAACGGGLFPCPDEPPPSIPPGPQPPTFAQTVIAVTLVSSQGGVDRAIADADIFFNPELPLSTNPAANEIDFETVMLHEIGHAVGLGHNDNCVVGPTIMESVIGLGESRRDLRAAELEGARFLYTDDASAAVRLFARDLSLRFDAVAGRLPPFEQTVSIYGRGGGRWLPTVSTTSGGNWVVLNPTSGRFPRDGELEVGVNSSNLPPGDYTATISINLEGHAGPAATVGVELHVEEALPLEERPFLTRAGIVNAANSASSALAPGSLFTLWGEFLSAATEEASSSPLPTTLGGTQVLVSGVAAPLLFVSPRQINGQIPAEVQSGTGGIIVRTGLGQTPSIPVDLKTAAPEFFLINGDQVLAINPDGSINSPENPAPQGSFVSVFLTGQGPVTPPVPSGRAAPTSPLSRVIPFSSAKLGGQDAKVLFLGLAPGFVGLAQANVELPAGLTGQQLLEITIDGETGSSGFISVE